MRRLTYIHVKNVHSSITYDSEKVEINQVSIDLLMDKLKSVHSYSEILFDYEQE